MKEKNGKEQNRTEKEKLNNNKMINKKSYIGNNEYMKTNEGKIQNGYEEKIIEEM